jgi:hypothetical protein
MAKEELVTLRGEKQQRGNAVGTIEGAWKDVEEGRKAKEELMRLREEKKMTLMRERERERERNQENEE